MLSIVVFGVICELRDENPYILASDRNPASAPKETEGSAPDTAQTIRWWCHRQTGWATLEQMPPWQRRWYAYRERRRKHVGVSFTEFADLSDGRRVTIRSDRGFSWSWRHSPRPWHGITRESLADDVQDYFVQVEADRPCSPKWVVEHLRRLYDIELDAASVQAALQMPRQVECGTLLLQQLPRDESSAEPPSGPPTQG